MTGFAKSNEKERKKHTSHWDFFSQNRTIQGVVIDNLDHEPVPYVSILFNDSIQIGMTNLDGSFQIEVPYTVNRLVLGRAIGFEDTELFKQKTS